MDWYKLLNMRRIRSNEGVTHLVDTRNRVRATLFANDSGIDVTVVRGDDGWTATTKQKYVGAMVVIYTKPFSAEKLNALVAKPCVVAINGSQTFGDVGFPGSILTPLTFRQYDAGDPRKYTQAKELLLHWLDELGWEDLFQ